MNLDKMQLLLDEERISGIKASWTDREIKNEVKSMLRMDKYSQLTDGRFIVEFIKRFEGQIRGQNLSRSRVRELAKFELERQKRLMA